MQMLVADDDEITRKTITASLEQLGHTAIEFSDGTDAWKAIQNPTAPHFLIMDWNMPGMTGLDICEEVQTMSDNKLLYTLLLTGRSGKDDLLKALRAGANDFISKPLDLAEFETRIARGINAIQTKKTLLQHRSRLAQSSRLTALGQMAAGLCHEINNPLTIIGGSAQQLEDLVQSKTADFEAFTLGLDRVNRGVARIAGIVRGMSLFAKNSEQETARTADLIKVIDDLSIFFQTRFRKHGIELRMTREKSKLEYHCQPVQLSQAILCLLDNAFDAVQGQESPWVEISILEKATEIQIAVTDSGSGVPAQIRERVFEPFFTTKEPGKGIGLGLSTAEGIVETHSGTLILDPESKNTSFVISLPKPPLPA